MKERIDSENNASQTGHNSRAFVYTTAFQEEPQNDKTATSPNSQDPEAFRGIPLKDRLMIYLTGFIVLAAVLTYAVFQHQANIMQDQLTEMRSAGEQTERLAILSQMINAAKEARNTATMADSSKVSVEAAQTEMRLEQRAWVDIKFGDFSWPEGKPLSVRAGFINTGKTPAEKLYSRTIVEKISRGDVPNFDEMTGRPAAYTKAEIFIPNDPVTNLGFHSLRYAPNSKIVEPLNISKDDVDDIDAGRAYIAVHGILQYTDIFGVPHWLKFCDYGGNMQLVQDFVGPCTKYNDADKNQQ